MTVHRVRERRWWLIPAAVAAGALVGLIVALLAPSGKRAEASVLVSPSKGSASVRASLPNVRALATGSVLAGNVRQTLRLNESTESIRHRLHASVRRGSDVIDISAAAGNGDRARALAQEAAVVLTQLVAARFRSTTPSLHATVFDAAHVVSNGDRHFGRDILIGATAGLILGLLGVALLGEEAAVPIAAPAGGVHDPRAEADLRERERLLEQRVKQVGERELAVAKRVGELAARERAITQAEAEAAAATAARREPEPKPAVAPVREPEPVEVAEPLPPLGQAHEGRTLDELERAVAAQTDAPLDRQAEWQAYLFYLRDYADIDGVLPARFDSLVDEAFGELFV